MAATLLTLWSIVTGSVLLGSAIGLRHPVCHAALAITALGAWAFS